MRSAVLLALLAACSFQPAGFGQVKDDAHTGGPTDDAQGNPVDDASTTDDAPIHPIDAPPGIDASTTPDAPPDAGDPNGDDPCGAFGQACCEESPHCGFLLACINGSCV